VEHDLSDGEPQVIDMDSTIDEDKEKGENNEDPMDEDGKKEGESAKDNAIGDQLPGSRKPHWWCSSAAGYGCWF
jgi:hypothetical protein